MNSVAGWTRFHDLSRRVRREMEIVDEQGERADARCVHGWQRLLLCLARWAWCSLGEVFAPSQRGSEAVLYCCASRRH
jgi:hypothetical protein